MFKKVSLILCSFYIFSSISICSAADGKIVYIHPGQWGDIFAINNPVFNRDNCLEPICRLKDKAAEKGIEIRQTGVLANLENFDSLIVFEVPTDQLKSIEAYPKEKCFLFLWEPPSVVSDNYDTCHHTHFSKVFTWRDDLVDNQKYFKLYYAVARPMVEDVIAYKDKKLSVLIACNKNSSHPEQLYGERQGIIEFFENGKLEDFDLYGKWWPTSYQTYKGPVERKVDILKKYKFCFAYENIKNMRGYVTEKIFDCFQAGCVPIYWGASNVTDYVPANCFIDRRAFSSNEALYTYLKEMSEEKHQEFIKNIQEYLNSDAAKPYSVDHFVDCVMNLIK